MILKDCISRIKGFKVNKKIFLIGVGMLLFIVLTSSAAIYVYVRSKIYQPIKNINSVVEGTEDKKELVETKDVKYDEVEGITNILLIGVDARELNENARSDSMMIATIDSNSKKLKLTSIMRDSYVDIYKFKTQKNKCGICARWTRTFDGYHSKKLQDKIG